MQNNKHRDTYIWKIFLLSDYPHSPFEPLEYILINGPSNKCVLVTYCVPST